MELLQNRDLNEGMGSWMRMLSFAWDTTGYIVCKNCLVTSQALLHIDSLDFKMEFIMLCLDVSNTRSSGTSEKVPKPVCAHQKAASVNQEETPWHRATSLFSSPSGLRDLSCSCKRTYGPKDKAHTSNVWKTYCNCSVRIVELSSDLSICLGIEDQVQHSVSLDSDTCQPRVYPTAEPQGHLHSDPFIFSLGKMSYQIVKNSVCVRPNRKPGKGAIPCNLKVRSFYRTGEFCFFTSAEGISFVFSSVGNQ